MVWIITDEQETEVPEASADGDDLWLSEEDTKQATGWQIKKEGLCRDDICMPVPAGRESEFQRENQVNIAAFWRHMDRPVVRDTMNNAWMLAPSADDQSSALSSLQAPDFCLPDLTGQMHSLSDYRGKKIFLATWASW